jgi:hypothetical protein
MAKDARKAIITNLGPFTPSEKQEIVRDIDKKGVKEETIAKKTKIVSEVKPQPTTQELAEKYFLTGGELGKDSPVKGLSKSVKKLVEQCGENITNPKNEQPLPPTPINKNGTRQM